ncbi:hypothetical protein [Methylomicrobium lacus]|uniref:hypothetical protein n=1 Tax=Methylomicrobium lacus TaxID=136992 RepID=UPI0035A93EE2
MRSPRFRVATDQADTEQRRRRELNAPPANIAKVTAMMMPCTVTFDASNNKVASKHDWIKNLLKAVRDSSTSHAEGPPSIERKGIRTVFSEGLIVYYVRILNALTNAPSIDL